MSESKQFEGTRSLSVGGFTVNSISPEARDLLDTAMIEWDKFKKNLPRPRSGKRRRPTTYMFAYWLIRYSGLVQPAPKLRGKCPVHGIPDCSPLLNGCSWKPEGN